MVRCQYEIYSHGIVIHGDKETADDLELLRRSFSQGIMYKQKINIDDTKQRTFVITMPTLGKSLYDIHINFHYARAQHDNTCDHRGHDHDKLSDQLELMRGNWTAID